MSLPRYTEPVNGGGSTSLSWYRWFTAVDRLLSGTTSDDGSTEAQPVQVNQGVGIQVTGNAGNGYNVSLRTLADSGTGTFKLITRDGFGRISGSEDGAAADVPYDNATSGLTATDVQAAIDEAVGLIPATTDDLPEGSTNLYFHDAPSDGTTYGRKNGAWAAAGGGGSGDVVGPASSTNSHVALFDGTTGKLLKDGGALATIATTGAVGDLTGFPGGTTDFLRADGSFAAPSGGGSSTAWTLLNSWDFSVSGATASFDTDLTGYNELMIVMLGVSLASTGYRGAQFSADGGTTWATTYYIGSTAGAHTGSSLNNMAMHIGAGNGAFYGYLQAPLLPFEGPTTGSGSAYFMPDFAPNKPNRIRFGGWSAAGAAINMTGGKVRILVR